MIGAEQQTPSKRDLSGQPPVDTCVAVYRPTAGDGWQESEQGPDRLAVLGAADLDAVQYEHITLDAICAVKSALASGA